MRGFTIKGIKFKVMNDHYFAQIGDYDGWLSIKPVKNGFEYTGSLLSGHTLYVTSRGVKDVALEKLSHMKTMVNRLSEALKDIPL